MKKITATDICLRAFVAGDAEAFAAIVRESTDTVGRWMGWCHAGFNTDDALNWFAICDKGREEGNAYEFGIFSQDGKTLLGGAGLNLLSKLHNYCNLGYWIGQPYQGQGIASKAAALLADTGFKELGLTRIEIVVAEGNHASIALAQKLGARLECMARNRLVVAGVPVAAAVHSLLPQDWHAALHYTVEK